MRCIRLTKEVFSINALLNQLYIGEDNLFDKVSLGRDSLDLKGYQNAKI